MWFKVDDKMHDHRKARQAGVAAMGLWCLAGSWCGDNLTDGFVPDGIAARWDRNYRKLAARLVEVGFWVPDEVEGESGWRFHDWHDLQPTREQVLAERAAAAERQRRAREKARESRRDSTRDSRGSHAGSHGPPDPTRPDPSTPPTPSRATKRPRTHPETPAPIPDADGVLAYLRTQEATPMPEGLNDPTTWKRGAG